MKSPQKPISMKRLRKLAENYIKQIQPIIANGMTITSSSDVWSFLSYVSDHKNDTFKFN